MIPKNYFHVLKLSNLVVQIEMPHRTRIQVFSDLACDHLKAELNSLIFRLWLENWTFPNTFYYWVFRLWLTWHAGMLIVNVGDKLWISIFVPSDAKLEPDWQVVVGKDFGTCVTPQSETLAFFYLGGMAFYIFKKKNKIWSFQHVVSLWLLSSVHSILFKMQDIVVSHFIIQLYFLFV